MGETCNEAILTALDKMNDGNDWIVDIDLEKFFDTVNHGMLPSGLTSTVIKICQPRREHVL